MDVATPLSARRRGRRPPLLEVRSPVRSADRCGCRTGVRTCVRGRGHRGVGGRRGQRLRRLGRRRGRRRGRRAVRARGAGAVAGGVGSAGAAGGAGVRGRRRRRGAAGVGGGWGSCWTCRCAATSTTGCCVPRSWRCSGCRTGWRPTSCDGSPRPTTAGRCDADVTDVVERNGEVLDVGRRRRLFDAGAVVADGGPPADDPDHPAPRHRRGRHRVPSCASASGAPAPTAASASEGPTDARRSRPPTAQRARHRARRARDGRVRRGGRTCRWEPAVSWRPGERAIAASAAARPRHRGRLGATTRHGTVAWARRWSVVTRSASSSSASAT